MGDPGFSSSCVHCKMLTTDDLEKLKKQDSQIISEFSKKKLEIEAGINWDKFYKRNDTRFFKDRHWTTREFKELIGDGTKCCRMLLEVGCGVGNFLYPLLEEKLDLFIYGCDISKRAVQFVMENKLYDGKKMKVFMADITENELSVEVGKECIDIASLIFVLSAIHPDKFVKALKNIYNCLRPGGILLFRDYAVNDMAMIRFGPGSKLGERFYARQDGTRSYYFIKEELENIASSAGFNLIDNDYIFRQTVNKKEGIDVQRVFIQAKFVKPNF